MFGPQPPGGPILTLYGLGAFQEVPKALLNPNSSTLTPQPYRPTMIPLQISLQGFMSYCERATFDFRGSALWMLSGANGAGKSAVFDALRWTLFGAHRGGRQKTEALIHHDAQSLKCELDLELGEQTFRLTRTHARTGRASWQIQQKGDDGWEAVPETDMNRGYDEWVREHLGLSDETFCAAVYLSQGRADAILSADRKGRYQLLSEIVDLSAYQALWERAETRRIEARDAAQLADQAFQNAPHVEAQTLDELGKELQQLGVQIEEIERQRAALVGSEFQAQLWAQWTTQSDQTARELATLAATALDSGRILADNARLEALESSLGALESRLAARARWEENQSAQQGAQSQLANAKRAVEARQNEVAEAQSAWETLNNAHSDARARWQRALEIAAQLAPATAQIEQWRTLQSHIQSVQTQLTRFGDDLDAQLETLRIAREKAEDAARHYPILRLLSRAREEWQRATQNASETRVQLANARVQHAADLSALEAHQVVSQTAQNALAATEIMSVLAQSRLEEAENAQRRFEEVAHEAVCHFCGQELSPQHRGQEQTRLQLALENAQTALQKALCEQENAQSQAQNAAQSLKDAAESRAALERQISGGENDLSVEERAAKQAMARVEEAFVELSPAWKIRFESATAQVWQSPFPTSSDLQELETRAATLASCESGLINAQAQARQRDDWQAQLGSLQGQIAPLAGVWNPDSARETLAAARENEAAKSAAYDAFQRLAPQLENAQKALKNARRALEDAETLETNAARESARWEAMGHEISRAYETINAPAPGEILAPLWALNAANLRGHLALWQEEIADLDRRDVRALAQKLAQLASEIARLESEIEGLQRQIAALPIEAQRSVDAIREDAGALQSQAENLAQWREEKSHELAHLRRNFAHKAALQIALQSAQLEWERWKTLAHLLGRDQLQRHLLREAENGIVDEANAVLDRISGGTLRLELIAQGQEVVGAHGDPKVLDVVAFHNEQSVLPPFLSGSQRFRVAVALALAIGRYATRGSGAGRMKTVIIDEGFGSLDKIGRAEMIEELRELGTELQRVILVSHQEEFAEAFAHRFEISHDGRASSVRLVS